MRFHRMLFCAILTLLGIASLPKELPAGVTICPTAPAGNWNGRYYYYCMTGSGGSACAGSGTMGSDSISHLLGCTGTGCNHSISTGGHVSYPEVHRPRPFGGAQNDDVTQDISDRPVGDLRYHAPYDFKTKVHSKFSYQVKYEDTEVTKTFRVLLITHDDVYIMPGRVLIPIAIVQEVDLRGALGNVAPHNNTATPATRHPINRQVWIWDIPMSVFHDNWDVNGSPDLEKQFDSTAPWTVNGLLIDTPGLAPTLGHSEMTGRTRIALSAPSVLNTDCIRRGPCSRPVSRRIRRRAYR